MPKQKTRKSAAKRYKITKTGKLLHRSQYLRHKRSKKSKKTLRSLKTLKKISNRYHRTISKMLGIA